MLLQTISLKKQNLNNTIYCEISLVYLFRWCLIYARKECSSHWVLKKNNLGERETKWNEESYKNLWGYIKIALWCFQCDLFMDDELQRNISSIKRTKTCFNVASILVYRIGDDISHTTKSDLTIWNESLLHFGQ